MILLGLQVGRGYVWSRISLASESRFIDIKIQQYMYFDCLIIIIIVLYVYNNNFDMRIAEARSNVFQCFAQQAARRYEYLRVIKVINLHYYCNICEPEYPPQSAQLSFHSTIPTRNPIPYSLFSFPFSFFPFFFSLFLYKIIQTPPTLPDKNHHHHHHLYVAL